MSGSRRAVCSDSQMMNEPNPLVKQGQPECTRRLTVSPIENISIVDVSHIESIAVKEELPAVCEGLDDVIKPEEKHQSDESECKKTWANLRESYRRAVVKKRTKSGQAATSSKKWQFEEEMSFLLPHMKQRKTISSLTEDDSELDENFDVKELLSNHDDSPMSSNDLELNITNRPESSTNTSANSPSFPNIPKRRRFKGTQACTSASAQLLQYLLKEKETNKDDEIDKFFSSIATTVKKLNRYNQSVLKSRIFNMVSEFELQEIKEQTNFYADSSRHNTGIESPSGYNTHNVGPLGYNTHNIGSLAYNIHNAGPSGSSTRNAGSSDCNLHNASPSGGSSDYNIHNAGPSDFNTRNAELSGNNPPVLEDPKFEQ